jgi:integrase
MCVVPRVADESPTLGLSHLQFEAMIVAARTSTNPFDFALVAMLGLLGLRIFEACATAIADLGEEHGHRVLRVVGKGTKTVLSPSPRAVGRAVDRAIDERLSGPILLNRNGNRMDRHAATRWLRRLAHTAGVRMPRMHLACCATLGTALINKDVPQEVVRRILDHESPQMTAHYANLGNCIKRGSCRRSPADSGIRVGPPPRSPTRPGPQCLCCRFV